MCVFVLVRPYFVLAFMSVCATVFRAEVETGEVYLVCAVNGDKRHRGGGEEGRS